MVVVSISARCRNSR